MIQSPLTYGLSVNIEKESVKNMGCNTLLMLLIKSQLIEIIYIKIIEKDLASKVVIGLKIFVELEQIIKIQH